MLTGPPRARRVPAHRGGQLGDTVARRDRDEPRALLREGRGERQDQPVRVALLGVALDLGQQAHGRDRDAVGPDARAAGIAQDAGRLDHRLVVLERLALALEHDARERALGRLAADREHLLDDLPGLEVAQEAQPAGLAEAAAEGAADLRRDAHAEARPLERDAHGLEHAAVRERNRYLTNGSSALRRRSTTSAGRGGSPAASSAAWAFESPRTPVEVVAVLSDDAVDDAAGDARGRARAGRGQGLGRLAAQVRHRHPPMLAGPPEPAARVERASWRPVQAGAARGRLRSAACAAGRGPRPPPRSRRCAAPTPSTLSPSRTSRPSITATGRPSCWLIALSGSSAAGGAAGGGGSVPSVAASGGPPGTGRASSPRGGAAAGARPCPARPAGRRSGRRCGRRPAGVRRRRRPARERLAEPPGDGQEGEERGRGERDGEHAGPALPPRGPTPPRARPARPRPCPAPASSASRIRLTAALRPRPTSAGPRDSAKRAMRVRGPSTPSLTRRASRWKRLTAAARSGSA